MYIGELVRAFRDRPFFEAIELDVLFDEPKPQIRARLSRWVQQDKLIKLRRGKYALAFDDWREGPSAYFISNYLHRPSYVSLHSALEFHGLIPESVAVIQAIVPRHGGEWETPLGRFRYHCLRQPRFCGYREYSSSRSQDLFQSRFLMATPEKALLDLFYLEKGEWTEARLQQMRFQNLEILDRGRLVRALRTMQNRRVNRSVERLVRMLEETGS